MIIALLVLVLATWITWVLFRDDRPADTRVRPAGGEDASELDREQRAGE